MRYLLVLVFSVLCLIVDAQAYLGTITHETELRERKFRGSEVIVLLEKGNPIFINSSDVVRGAYHAIDIITGFEGYIRKKHIALGDSVPVQEQGFLKMAGKSPTEKPMVVVYNSTGNSLDILVGNILMNLAPQEKKEVYLIPREYLIRVSGVGIVPLLAREAVEEGIMYIWLFYDADKEPDI